MIPFIEERRHILSFDPASPLFAQKKETHHPKMGGQVIAIAANQTTKIIMSASFLDRRLLE